MSNSCEIKFGTSGWRAIIADEFTFDNVRLVSQAIADFLKANNSNPQAVIGYDTRFLSAHFAKTCVGVLAANKIKVFLANRDVPTPVIAFHVIDKRLSGAVNFTASHNPAQYNGIKFSPAYGGPASREVTADIEKRIKQLQMWPQRIMQESQNQDFINVFDPRPEYLRRLKKLVDFKAIKKAKLKIAVDCLYGTSRGYLDELIRNNCKRLLVFNNKLNPLFGGNPPEPDKAYIKELINTVKKDRFNLGLSCDGDADRFGIVDRGGIFLSPNQVFTLLFYFLIKTRGKVKKVARTFATTHMIDAIAAKEGMEVIETPVGFKYIGEALSKGDCLIGGEESGGLSILGHVPEKDGILACLLIAEMVAREKKSLLEILEILYRRYGYFYSDRINLHLKDGDKERLVNLLESLKNCADFGGIKIKDSNFNDGYKFIFAPADWVMFRISGTEPVVRCYLEADSPKKLNFLKQVISKVLKV